MSIELKPFEDRHVDLAVPWLAYLYRDRIEDPENPGPEQRETLAYYLREQIWKNPLNELHVVMVDGEPRAVVGLLNRNPIERNAALFFLSDRSVAVRRRLRRVTEWIRDQIVPHQLEELTAFCREEPVRKMLESLGFQEKPISGTALSYTAEAAHE